MVKFAQAGAAKCAELGGFAGIGMAEFTNLLVSFAETISNLWVGGKVTRAVTVALG